MNEKDNGTLPLQREFLERLFVEMPCAAAMHRIVCDETGEAVDYAVTRVNPAFCTLLETTEESVVEVNGSKRLSPKELRHWLRVFAPVALEGKTTNFTIYSQKTQQAYYGTAICPERGSFFVMFRKAEDWNPDIMRLP
jgi:PAS domain-containing protein